MSSLRGTFAELYRTLREAPDDLLLELGADGEVLLARLRLLFASLLILLPVINYFTGGGPYESLIGLTGVGIAMLLSQLWLTLARRRRRYRWLPTASACFDVSIVSMVLLLLAFRDPAKGLNSIVVFSCYPLVVLATALRNDVRVTLLCGALAIAQFMAISMFFMHSSDQPLYSPDYGTVQFSSQLQRTILLFASTLVTALIVFRMQRLIHVSGTDGLTGLPNRSFLSHHVPQIIADASSCGESLSLCLIDLDYFKRINDELGHQAGDRALRHVVDTLRAELNRDEAMLRVGGEEFVLILRMPLGAAWERMDSLRRRLEIKPFLLDGVAGERMLTFSVGIACCPADGMNVSALMGSADARLRTAKLTGRNRVVARDAQ